MSPPPTPWLTALHSAWRAGAGGLASAILCFSQACASPPELPEATDAAYLPYIEAVELPENVYSGEPFTLRLKLSTLGSPGVLKNGAAFISRSSSSGEAYIVPYFSSASGGVSSADGWYEFQHTLIGYSSLTEPTPAKVYLLGAPDPALGGYKGTVSFPSRNLRFLVDYRRLEFEVLLHP